MTTLGFYASDGSWDDNISRENPEKLELVVLPAPKPVKGEPLPRLFESLGRLDWQGAAAAIESAAEPAHDAVSDVAADAKAGADKSDYRFRPGEAAQVIVRSPFAGRLLLCVETDDVVSTRVIEMTASQASVPVEVPEACRPGAYVTATVLRPSTRRRSGSHTARSASPACR